jgi:hypothetical protein
MIRCQRQENEGERERKERVREIKKEKERGGGRECERHQVIFEIYILKRERIIIFHYVCLSSLQNWQHFQIRFFPRSCQAQKLKILSQEQMDVSASGKKFRI